jgi:hypothetical protein
MPRKASAALSGVPIGIRTEHLPNMSQEHYSYANPFGDWVLLVSCQAYTSTLKMEAVCSADDSGDFFWLTQCHISGDDTHSERVRA